MTSFNQIIEARIVVGKFTPDIFLSSKSYLRDDYFYVIVNKKIIAHIYKRKKNWYIWYCKKAYRFRVNSFTDACNFIEKEILDCVA